MPEGLRPAQLIRKIADRRQARAALADPLGVQSRWLREPLDLTDRDVCLLVSWAPKPQLAEHAVYLARAWAAQGFAVILVAACDDLANFDLDQDLEFCEGILLRANIGYDFGAWAHAIRSLPAIDKARLLVLANDSVFGPFDGFNSFIQAARTNPAGLVGAIGSSEIRPHLQSFLLFFKADVLRHPAFHSFWNKIRNGDRRAAIRRYELPLKDYFTGNGIKVASLFPRGANTGFFQNIGKKYGQNPGLTMWRELINDGFPFIKIQLLRDNPTNTDICGWELFLEDKGYDPAIIQRYLATNAKRPIKNTIKFFG